MVICQNCKISFQYLPVYCFACGGVEFEEKTKKIKKDKC